MSMSSDLSLSESIPGPVEKPSLDFDGTPLFVVGISTPLDKLSTGVALLTSKLLRDDRLACDPDGLHISFNLGNGKTLRLAFPSSCVIEETDSTPSSSTDTGSESETKQS